MTALASRYLRQLDIYNPEDHSHDSVTFVGVGGIGSFAAFGAAKLGVPNVTLIDPDIVEEHNQPNQMYNEYYLDDLKVEAMSHLVLGANPQARVQDLDIMGEEAMLDGLVVSGLDSMEARKTVWEESVKLNPRVPLYIDGRLSGQLIVIYAVNPTSMDDIEHYEATLHSDEEGEDVSCTARGIIDVGLMVGALMTRMIRRHLTNQEVDHITVYNGETLAITSGDWVR